MLGAPGSASASALAGHAYYVSPSGNDNSPGTLKEPWKTIQHAANSTSPGDTVYVREGTYHEVVSLTTSGTKAGGYITFENYPGEKPILDGSTLTPPADTWSAFFLLTNQSYIVIKGFEMRNYVATLPGQEPAGVLVTGYGSDIQILDNKIHDIHVVRASGVGCDPDSCNGHGIAIYGLNASPSLSNILVAGNEVYNLQTGWSESVTLDGNVQDWSVTNNTIHHNNNIGIDAAGHYGFDPDENTDYARDGEIGGNLVYDIDTTGNLAYQNPDGTYSQFAAGIYVDGGARIVMEQNDSHDNDLGIEVASENTGYNSDRVTVRNNLIYHSLNLGIAIGGYDPTVGGTSNTEIVNNTLYANDTLQAGFGELFLQSNITKCVFKNNLLYANSQGLFISNYVPFNTGPRPVAVDYNLYFSADGESGSSWMWNNTYYTGYESYRSASGNDVHSPFADPMFVNSTANPPDLRTRPGSPARNAGIDLGAAIVGVYDFAGNPRVRGNQIDIGAYEHTN
ncbi:MAG: right-handed parallel beta-helix repeat-containing protein [Terracidiphilus sp.]|jgi:hypothetical protein